MLASPKHRQPLLAFHSCHCMRIAAVPGSSCSFTLQGEELEPEMEPEAEPEFSRSTVTMDYWS